MAKVFIFDLDGTLIDSLDGIEHSFNLAVSEVLSSASRVDIRKYIGPPIRDICRQVHPEASEADLDSIESKFRLSYDSEGWLKTHLFPGVTETLNLIRASGRPLHILTNKPYVPTRLILAKFGLLDFFESIVTRETSLPPFESKAAAAEHMKNSIGVPPSDVVLIGDSVDDAVAAKACGFRFAAAAYGFGQVCVRCPSSVDYVLDEFSSAALLIQ